MSKKIKYQDEPIEAKIIEFFKAEAAKHHTQYQRMIRNLIDSYVDAYDKPTVSDSALTENRCAVKRNTRKALRHNNVLHVLTYLGKPIFPVTKTIISGIAK